MRVTAGMSEDDPARGIARDPFHAFRDCSTNSACVDRNFIYRKFAGTARKPNIQSRGRIIK